MAHNQEQTQSIETDPRVTEMLESAHEDFKNSCYKYAKDLKKTRTQQSKREETRKKQMEILDLKIRTHELEIQ